MWLVRDEEIVCAGWVARRIGVIDDRRGCVVIAGDFWLCVLRGWFWTHWKRRMDMEGKSIGWFSFGFVFFFSFNFSFQV